MLEHLGCERRLLPNTLYLGKKIPLAGVAHQNGTLRFFPSSAAVNPALTIMANALRIGDHLVARFRARETRSPVVADEPASTSSA